MALFHIICYVGVKCPRSLRGIGSSSEVTVSKLKTYEVRSHGGNKDYMRPERDKPAKESLTMLDFLSKRDILSAT